MLRIVQTMRFFQLVYVVLPFGPCARSICPGGIALGSRTSSQEMEQHWASSGPTTDDRMRDAHCHEAGCAMFVGHPSGPVPQNYGIRTCWPEPGTIPLNRLCDFRDCANFGRTRDEPISADSRVMFARRGPRQARHRPALWRLRPISSEQGPKADRHRPNSFKVGPSLARVRPDSG